MTLGPQGVCRGRRGGRGAAARNLPHGRTGAGLRKMGFMQTYDADTINDCLDLSHLTKATKGRLGGDSGGGAASRVYRVSLGVTK